MASDPIEIGRQQGLPVTPAVPSGDPTVDVALGDESVTSVVNKDELRWRIKKEKMEKRTDLLIKQLDKKEEINAKRNERHVKLIIIIILSSFAFIACAYAFSLTSSQTDNEAKAKLNHQTADKVFALAVSGVLAVMAGRGLK
jgi:Tfp pilus assembly protein PilO